MRKHLHKIFFILISFLFLSGFTYYYIANQYWYQQTMPDLGSVQLTDIQFLDSLNGFACTNGTSSTDGYILKTTNGGDNWNIVLQRFNTSFNTLGFLDKDFGYVCSTPDSLFKTTDGGNSWLGNSLGEIFSKNMSVLNKDTLWLSTDSDITGGVFVTTNGGTNWVRKFNETAQNPLKIKMLNSATGFIARSGTINSYLRKTTDGGNTWNLISGATGFGQMHFTDSLTGWKNVSGNLEKTTDGGQNWVRVFNLYFGNTTHQILDFKVLSKDTIWGVGGYILTSNGRALVYKSTNGGTNWTYQIPDTSIHAGTYQLMDFNSKSYGWCYSVISRSGIHTKVGGEPIEYPVGIKNLSSEVANSFNLYQNYPNPFNPSTQINYELKLSDHIKLTVFDINGKEVQTLVNKKQAPGSYTVVFNASNFSSGVYFYSIQTQSATETKKMLLVK